MGRAAETMGCIAEGLRQARRPAVLWSGGKDSTVLLHYVRRFRPDVEVILWRVPWLPAKWAHHERVARAWNLTVFDFPPAWAAVCHGRGRIDLMEAYQIGARALVVARGTEPMEEGRPWVCGRQWLERPKAGQVEFPWDVLFHGHKSVDEDPCSGGVPLAVDRLECEGSATIFYPLRHWTDAEVAEYTVEQDLPWDGQRYELVHEGGRPALRTLKDKHGNSDYYHTCLRCLDKREGRYVRCPATGMEIENVSGRVQEYEPVMDYCGLRTNAAAAAAVRP